MGDEIIDVDKLIEGLTGKKAPSEAPKADAKPKTEWKIPTSWVARIREMAEHEKEIEIELECCQSRRKSAIQEGDATKAKAEHHLGHELATKAEEIHDKLWEAIGQAVPEIPREKDGKLPQNLTLIRKDMSIKQRKGVDSLGEAIKRAVEGSFGL